MSAAGPVLVTGAAGYIGSRVCGRLLASGYDVRPVDNFQQAAVDTIGDVSIETVDVRDRSAVRAAIDGAAAVIPPRGDQQRPRLSGGPRGCL